MTSLETINEFVSGKKIAIAGVSSNPKKFSSTVFRDLKKKGYDVVPVNPKYNELLGEKCFYSVKDLDESYNRLLIVLPIPQMEIVFNEAVEKGISHIWLQQKQFTPKVVALAEEKNIKLVYNECIYMWTNPHGIHKLHRTLRSVFGKMPK